MLARLHGVYLMRNDARLEYERQVCVTRLVLQITKEARVTHLLQS